MGEVETSSQDVHQASVPPNGPSTWYPAASKDLQEFLYEENQKNKNSVWPRQKDSKKKRGKKKIMKKEKKKENPNENETETTL